MVMTDPGSDGNMFSTDPTFEPTEYLDKMLGEDVVQGIGFTFQVGEDNDYEWESVDLMLQGDVVAQMEMGTPDIGNGEGVLVLDCKRNGESF